MVRTGVTSSLEAATEICEIADAKSSPDTWPLIAGISGRVGYSSIGMVRSENLAEPQFTWTLDPSVEKSMAELGSLLTISASRRPETKTRPGCSTLATISTWAEVS